MTCHPMHACFSRGARRCTLLITGLVLVALQASALSLLAHPALASSSASKNLTPKQSPDALPGQLVVAYKSGTSTGTQRSVLRKQHARLVDGLEAVDEEARHDMDLVKVKGNVNSTIKRLERDPSVKFAEPNFTVSTSAIPNDPGFSTFMWGLDNTGQTINGFTGTAGADIDAPEAWDIARGSNQVTVAVVDTGIDYRHDDLKANIWENLDETAGNKRDDDGNGFVDDVRGWDFAGNDNDPADVFSHGTHVAGTIGAVGNNGLGVTGVNWVVRLMPVKVLGDDGFGSNANTIAGFAYAVANGAHIVNASLGSAHYSQATKDVIDGARDKTLFIVAAGNDGKNVDQSPDYPCGYESANLICVAATDSNDQLAGFSNYGVKSVDTSAPGVNILSTLPDNKYGFKNGTSMATPHVAGAAALLQTMQTGIKPLQAKQILLTLYDDIPGLEGKVDQRRRLGLPTQEPPMKKIPTPKKPEPGTPAPVPNPAPDRPDLPNPALPGAPNPDIDYYTPVVGGGRTAVIIIGMFTQVPTLTEIDGTIGNVNRTFVERVITSLKYKKGRKCWYMTDDPRVPWLKHSCNDKLYLDLNTDSSSGTFDFPLSPKQRGGLCRGKYTITTRLVTTAGESIVIGKRHLSVKKGGKSKRCKKRKKKRKK